MTLSAANAPAFDSVGRRGALVYEFERAGARTVLARSACSSPWHHFPPSYPDDSGCAYTWLVNPSGGLVGGDHVSVEATLHAGTHVLMTGPSATRVYRSLSEPSIQEVRLSVGQAARLEWLPEVTIPFAGSRFRQSIRVDLAPEAAVVLWDALASGRIATGERWDFAQVTNEIDIRTYSGDSVVERFHVTSDSVGAIMKKWDYLGTLFIIADGVAKERLEGLASSLNTLCDAMPHELIGGVSEPAVSGLVVKVVATSAHVLTAFLDTAWSLIRQQLWNLPPTVLRRY